MLKQGPIPAFAHGLLEYIFGLALIALPLVLNYKHGSATAASIVLGVAVLFLAATTTSSTSLINTVPLAVHVLLDYALAAILIASPFLFGFSGESTPTAVFIALGIVHLLGSIGTRYRKDETPGRGERKRRRERPERVESSGAAGQPALGEEIPEHRPPGRES